MSEGPPPVITVADASQRVYAPAVALMVTGIVGAFGQLVGFVLNLLGMGVGTLVAQNEGSGVLPMLFSGSLAVVLGLVSLLLSGLLIYAALKMQKLQSWGLCVAAGIVAAVPCISPCCLLGLPIGIWCLVVLFNAEVKAAFR